MTGETTFWLCLGWLAYVYAGYPACALLLSRFLNREVRKADVTPTVTVVISAFNEERDIERTLLNKLSQDYPADRLVVLLVSDGSTDRTDEIARQVAARSGGRVTVLRQEPRQGKTQALNSALQHVRSDIAVFSDANSHYAPDAIRKLVRSFADPSVGYVTGRLTYTNPTDTAIGQEAGLYMRYENLLWSVETRLGSVVGADGGLDAIRRELYVAMRPDQLPDFVLPLSVVEQGRRVVYEPDARVYEPALADAADELRMRVRVSLRALWALHDMRRLLNPLRNPLFAWQLVSHKLLRYVAFIPLAGLLVSNALVAADHPFYSSFFALQLAAYLLAGAGHFVRRWPSGASKLLVPYYFVVLNSACLIACWKFLNGQKMVVWRPRQGE